jgi:hypothetical protein
VLVTNGLIIVWTNKLLSTEPYLVIEIGCSEAKECIHLIMRRLVNQTVKRTLKMKRKKIVIILSVAAVLAEAVGVTLNRIEILLNRGMPAFGYTVAFGRYVPLNQGTKLVFLADVIRMGDYILSVGDLLLFTGMVTALIALWIAMPQGRKFFPFLIASLFGIFLSIAKPNHFIPTVLYEIAALGSILAMYWTCYSNVKKKVVVKR